MDVESCEYLKKITLSVFRTRGLSNPTEDLTADELDRSATWLRKGFVMRLRDATEGNAVGLL